MEYKSYKIRLELNDVQRTNANKHSGVARHAYNWGVSIINDLFDNNFDLYNKGEERVKFPTAIDLHKRLVSDVKSENKWYYDVSKWSPQESLRDLEKALKNYFRKLKKGEINKLKADYIKKKSKNGGIINYVRLNNIGKPKFKKKGQNDNFYLEGDIKISGNKIKVPKFGWIKMSENLGEIECIKNVKISKKCNDWFISFKTEFKNKVKYKKQGSVGVDLGIKKLATLSNGMVFSGSKPFRKYKRKLKIEQRKLSKKYNKETKTQSNNYKKQQMVVAKLHNKIANIRKDDIHKLTTYLSKNHTEIVIENLNVSGMIKNHKLASAIIDGGFFEFKRQLEYKCNWYGTKLIIADRFFPSSKKCSCCGNIKKDLKLKDRVYNCEKCGISIDRDINASLNLKQLAVSYTVTACGELYQSMDLIQRNSMKQEINSEIVQINNFA
ncbi:MAG: RNA-guided endonuclease TnpB family protein [Candidatus Izemoplasmatales bacterium]